MEPTTKPTSEKLCEGDIVEVTMGKSNAKEAASGWGGAKDIPLGTRATVLRTEWLITSFDPPFWITEIRLPDGSRSHYPTAGLRKVTADV